MNISKPLTIALCLILASGQILTPQSASAGNVEISTFDAGPAVEPIGKIEAAGQIIINGRVASGKEAVWDGELLQIPANSNANVSLENIGQVMLKGGSVVRLATISTKLRDQINHRALSASVVNGEMDVKLNGEAIAFVQAGRFAYLANAGANFHVSVHDDAAKLHTLNGAVLEIGNWAIRMPTAPPGTASNPTINARKPVNDSNSLNLATVGKKNSLAERESLVKSIRLLSNSFGEGSNSTARLHANAMARMIGVAESSGDMIINRRSVRGKEWLWDGEVLQSPNAATQVTLNGIGKVMLSSGAEVKLSAAVAGGGGSNQRRALVASLIQGKISVLLDSGSEAYIQSKGEAFVASGGSEFRLSSDKSGATVGVMKGDVHSIGGWIIEMAPQIAELLVSIPRATAKASPRKYFIIPVESGYQTSVQATKTRELKFRVADERSQPAPGLPVTFILNNIDGKGIGTLGYGQNADNSFTVVTDAQGVATVPFKAGSKPGSVSISAAVEGASEPQSNVVTVTKAEKEFWTKKNAVPVFATAAAMIVAGIVVVATRDDKLPIKGPGPIDIIP